MFASSLRCICLAAFTVLAPAHAIPSSMSQPSSACTSLLGIRSTAGINVLNATVFASEALNATGVLNIHPLCRVQGTITYAAGGNDTPDPKGRDTLTWELYLPMNSEYNGRFMVVGNGGYAGNIADDAMMAQLNLGYAVAGCDSGHSLADSGNTTYAPFLADKAMVKAWIHNSIAMITPITKALTTEYYAKNPDFTYYYGCSTGGGQGYALAQYHPDLFDGIYAGSPGNWYSHLILSFLWNGLHTAGSGYMTQDALNFITDSLVDACDALDGVVDGLIENPLKCNNNITQLECRSGQNPISADGTVVCITADQIEAVQAIYAGPKNVVTGGEVYPGMSLGSENGWLLQETILYEYYSKLILQELVFDDLAYNVSTFNWGTDVHKVDELASPLIDEISPDLSAFVKRGGKLVTTQGWADQFNAATWPIQHLDQIRARMNGVDIDDFIKVFMVPGGGHCGANPEYPHVPGTYDVLDVLVPWVEQGIRPLQMLSTTPPDGTNTTRKLCPWPETARYVVGNIDEWTSYICA